jgi:hypothetical protein
VFTNDRKALNIIIQEQGYPRTRKQPPVAALVRLGRVMMLKLLPVASLLFAFALRMTELTFAQTIAPPSPPNIRYVLPGAAAGYSADRPREGRSIYRMEAPSTFYYGTNERGYPGGKPQNPLTSN